MQNKSFPKAQSSQGSYNNNNAGQNNQNVRLSPTEYDAANKHMKDRFIYALANSLGTKITVTTGSDKITGILQSISDVNDTIPSLILKYPTRPDHVYDDEFLLIPESSISMIACENLDFTPKTSSSSAFSSANNQSTSRKGFKIDTDISNVDSFRERDLQKWVPEEDDSSNLALALEEEKPSDANKWDQFKANKDKFGIDAKFDENDYTVKLNVSNPNFKERMKFAETVSREILSQSTNGNLHIAEERGKLVDAENIDEEDKYSGVLRDNAESEKKLMNMLKTSKPDTTESTTPVAPSQSKPSGQYIPPNQRIPQVQKDATSASAKRSPPAASAASIAPVQLPEKPTTIPQTKDTKKPPINEPSTVSKKPAVVPTKPAAPISQPANPTKLMSSASSATLITPVASTSSSTAAGTPATLTPQHVQKPQQQQQAAQSPQSLQQNSNAALKQKSPQLQKQTFASHTAEQTQHQHQPHQHQHQHQQQHPQQHPQQHQNIPQQVPPQIQQQQPQHMMRNQQFGYQPRNGMGNQQQYGSPSMQYRNHNNATNHNGNQYNQNYNNNNANTNQRMKKASPQFVFLHRPSDKSPRGSILGDKFNILLSAKKEYSSNKTNVSTDIIPMVPSFHASPSWPETTSESYSEVFTKENNSHTSMHMQQPVYLHPQAYPQNHQQAYMGFQVQPPYYFPIVPSYPVYLPNVSFPMMGGNQGMDKVYPNHARHGNKY